MSQWFTKSPGQVLSELGVSQNTGLTSRQGRERLEKYGPNRLAGVKKALRLLMGVDSFLSSPFRRGRGSWTAARNPHR